MKNSAFLVLSFASALLVGCELKPGAGVPPKSSQGGAAQVQGSKSIAPGGAFRLVKVQDSGSVFVLEGGKISAIENWGWVERNAPGRPVEVITKAELDSYPVTGVSYR